MLSLCYHIQYKDKKQILNIFIIDIPTMDLIIKVPKTFKKSANFEKLQPELWEIILNCVNSILSSCSSLSDDQFKLQIKKELDIKIVDEINSYKEKLHLKDLEFQKQKEELEVEFNKKYSKEINEKEILIHKLKLQLDSNKNLSEERNIEVNEEIKRLKDKINEKKIIKEMMMKIINNWVNKVDYELDGW